MTATQKQTLLRWYEVLDREFGEHGDPDSACPVCIEALELGIIGD